MHNNVVTVKPQMSFFLKNAVTSIVEEAFVSPQALQTELLDLMASPL